ncbi:TOMM precursor leader peptide-binding protein [Cellulomonas dongxiuzhuiae]|uniref:TOMM leader peptide-binding protein n=1 Tax=Cellulomonas dongxiuzhuiae TaxID=2819979 RepID=A0ABX8GG60_9CELL|nr:TOMM precursor leader peptide-binding protein [Cellulomonas dongxiuzhuiae]MBO3094047.1 TOMM precursor leader peptide-binding protein [Cellulomonas dongxiuzhuiae]QWC15114.1 TOMM precursor leader peptide-binding protein [Cellulomonas dongxiuzhuiae]
MSRPTRDDVLLRPGLRVLPRADDEVQVGTDPRWAVRLTGLAPAEAVLWSQVDDTTDLTRLADKARAAGLDAELVAATVAELRRAGLTRARPDATTAVHGPAAADATAWSLLLPDATGDAVVAARARAVVGVVGLGPTGLGVARQLAVAGVGGLLLDDDAPVRSPDVAAGTHRWADVGTPRVVAARRLLREASPGVRTDGDGVPGVVVVVEHEAADPVRAVRLMGEDLPHLSVVVRTADALVGPFVRPGTDPCLRCLDLHRTDVDRGWPAVLGALTRGSRPGATPPGEVGVLAGACAALAAAQVLALLAGTTPSLCGATVELALPDLVARERRWAVHPACGCRRLPRSAEAGPHEG